MADEEADVELDEEDDGEGGGVTGKKKLIIIAAAVVVLLLVAGGAAFFFMSGGEEHAEETEHATEESASEHGTLAESGENAANAARGPKMPVYYDVPEFLVDLSSSDRGKSSFLKMKVAIELSSPEDVKILEAYMPRVRDNFITYLRELRASDLSGSAGLYRLREELMLRINQAIAPAKVNNILFKEIIVQ